MKAKKMISLISAFAMAASFVWTVQAASGQIYTVNAVDFADTTVSGGRLGWSVQGVGKTGSTETPNVWYLRESSNAARKEMQLSVNVEEAGTYTMDIYGVFNIDGLDEKGYGYSSSLEYKVNNDTAFTRLSNTTASYFKCKQTPVLVGGAWVGDACIQDHGKHARLNNKISLNAGKNTITLGILPLLKNSSNHAAILDCIKLYQNDADIPADFSVSATGMAPTALGEHMWLDAKGYGFSSTMSSATGVSGETALSLITSYNADKGNPTAAVSLNVEKSGLYNLELYGAFGTGEGGTNWMGSPSLTIDGSSPTVKKAKTATSKVSYGALGATNCTLDASSIYLEKGIHRVQFLINKAIDGTALHTALDTLSVTPIAARALADGETLELEEFLSYNSGFSKNTHANESDSCAAVIGPVTGDEKKYTALFSVASDGDYYFTIGAAERGGADWLSPMKMTINGVDYGYFRKADYTVDAFECQKVAYAVNGNYKFNSYVTKKPIQLNAGDNIIEFTVYNAKNNSYNGTICGGNHICAGLDYLTMNKVKTLNNPQMILKDTMAVGDSADISLQQADGTVITKNDVYSITYRSTIETIASVSAEGSVTALNPGRTKIIAEIKINPSDSSTIELSQWVDVVDDDIFISNLNISENGAVTFDVVNNDGDWTDYSNIMAVVTAVSDNKLKAVATYPIAELNYGTSAYCNVVLSEYDSMDDVCIMVFDDLDHLKPLLREKKIY